MNYKEAIKYICFVKNGDISEEDAVKAYDALDMAIEALEEQNEPTFRKHLKELFMTSSLVDIMGVLAMSTLFLIVAFAVIMVLGGAI